MGDAGRKRVVVFSWRKLESREGWEKGRSHRAEDLANPREQGKRREERKRKSEHGAWIHERSVHCQ